MGRRGRERAELEFATGVVNARVIALYEAMLRSRARH
jgi:hypothetical protein